MSQLIAYLNFPGTCREAMTFYQQCLGGQLHLTTFEESPMAAQLPAATRAAILHAHLTSGPLKLMASDNPMSEVVNGNSVSLSLDCASEDETARLFAGLAAGGRVTMPLADQFWGARFGMLTDQFGIHWMVNYDRS